MAKITRDGQIDHLGRMDGQIKLNGHRIELGEIDAAMAEQPGVRLAATVLREDQPGDKRLVGYLLSQDDAELNVSQVREAIAKKLPEYMVPATIVTVDEFHYTPSGKLDRKAFPAPSGKRPDLANEYVAPTSEQEHQLARIWCRVLSLEKVGVQDNFFELGGNSIRAVKAVKQMREECSLNISNAEFFDNPTIRSLLQITSRKQSWASQAESSNNSQDNGEYAIVGMAVRLPGAGNLESYWRNLVQGKEAIRFFEPEELDTSLPPSETQAPNYVPARGIVDDATSFDARFFGITPRAAELTDPQQRVMLEIAWTALEDAAIVPSKSESVFGIWAGTYQTTYYINNLLSDPDLVQQTGAFQLGTYNEKDYIALRVAHALNFTGPAINVNTACSTSLVAVIEACKGLASRQCDVALAGGVSIQFPQNSGHLHQEGSIFSPDGHCRPFDSQAAGTLFCDGAGVVVIKRLADAIENQDRIYAVVKGCGLNNDGGDKASFRRPASRAKRQPLRWPT